MANIIVGWRPLSAQQRDAGLPSASVSIVCPGPIATYAYEVTGAIFPPRSALIRFT